MSEVDEQFEHLLEFVRDTRGFDYTGYRRPTLTRRFEKRMQTVGAADWSEYREYLEQHPEEFGELFNAILINVTGFFRDRETWDVVAQEVIPQVLESRGESAIRVWSAGCASGEEPYTITMLLAEALGEDDFRSRVKIYATDVDDQALTEAREAGYTAKQLQDVPDELRGKYFQPANGGFAFRNDLRRCVIFGRNDLHKDPPISRVDLLVSRNTLMYFSPEIQERILANFHFALRPRGFLVVGKAEALQKGRRLFAPYNLKRRVFVKDGTVEPGFRVPHLGYPLDGRPANDGERDLGDAAFEHAPVAQLVVDADSRIAAVNQSARAMFGLKLRDVGRPLQDLEISYRPVELRSIISDVRARQKPAGVKNIEWNAPRGAVRFLDVQVSPLRLTPDNYVGVSIAFVDVTIHRTLEDDLERARRELEAAYEELQSTVEELETMNEELQSTNEELETMNDELRERTDETLRANAFLASVLSSVHQAVVVVDRELRVLAWNRLATDLLGLLDDEVEGEQLLGLDIGLPVGELREPLQTVLGNGQPGDLQLDGHNRRGHAVTYAVQLAPLLGGNDEDITGAILLMTAERRT